MISNGHFIPVQRLGPWKRVTCSVWKRCVRDNQAAKSPPWRSPLHLLVIWVHGVHLPGLVNVHIAKWKITIFKFGKSTINGPCSIAMLVYQRVCCAGCSTLITYPYMTDIVCRLCSWNVKDDLEWPDHHSPRDQWYPVITGNGALRQRGGRTMVGGMGVHITWVQLLHPNFSGAMRIPNKSTFF